MRRGGRHESNLSLDELEFARLAREKEKKAEWHRREALRKAFAAEVKVGEVAVASVWEAESEAGSSEGGASEEGGADVITEVGTACCFDRKGQHGSLT